MVYTGSFRTVRVYINIPIHTNKVGFNVVHIESIEVGHLELSFLVIQRFKCIKLKYESKK